MCQSVIVSPLVHVVPCPSAKHIGAHITQCAHNSSKISTATPLISLITQHIQLVLITAFSGESGANGA